MTLGERCDEIVRLIDATLQDCAQSQPVPGARRAESTPAPADEDPTVARLRNLARRPRRGLPRSA